MNDYKNSDMAAAIAEYCHSERDRAILSRRYIDGVHFDDLASEFDMSVRGIQNLIYKYRFILFKIAQ